MKKVYEQPQVEVIEIEVESVLCQTTIGSGVGLDGFTNDTF